MDFAKRYAGRAMSLVLAVSVAQSSFAQAPAPPTLWSFLGFPRTGNLRAQFVNRRGNLPGLEKKPPLKNIADPANLDPKMPDAIKKAAEVKQAEDLAPQKIKAIKYLAQVGCGCYPGVEEALVKALEDCTEEVRYEAVQAFITAAGDRCNTCSGTCCTPEAIAKLNDMATGMDEKGCYKEASARVRAAAAQAARMCEERLGPEELPPPPPVPPPPPEGGGDAPPPTVTMRKHRSAMSKLLYPGEVLRSMMVGDASTSTPDVIVMDRPIKAKQHPSVANAKDAPHRLASLSGTSSSAAPVPQPERAPGQRLKGTVAWVGQPGMNVRLQFPKDQTPNVGEELRVYHDYLTGRQLVGKLEVVVIGSDGVWARPLGGSANQFSGGDDVVTMVTEAPSVEPQQAVAKGSKAKPLASTSGAKPKLTPIKQPAKSSAPGPRFPSPPAVQVTDAQAKPLSKAQPAQGKQRPAPVVQKHLPPRTAARPTTSQPPKLFAPPPAATAPSQTKAMPTAKPQPVTPAPIAIPAAKPNAIRAVAQSSRPVWVGDSKVEFATDQK